MSEDQEIDRITIFLRFARAIAKVNFITLDDDLIEDLIVGGVTNVLSGQPPSSMMIMTAYDMNINPTAQGIVDYIFAERRKVKETFDRTNK